MRRFSMSKKQNQHNRFILRHECGSTFMLTPKLTIELFNQGYTLRCLHCFKKIDDETKNQIWQFCQAYLDTFNILSKKNIQLNIL